MRPLRMLPGLAVRPLLCTLLLVAAPLVETARAQKAIGTKAAEKVPPSAAVVVTGSGATPDDALRSALRQAVGQVMGELVDSETLTKNDELITDKILTYSKGYVSEWHELKSWKDDGLIFKQLLVKVQRRELVIILNKHGINPRPFDGRRLYARIVTGLLEEKEARLVLRRLFEKYPACVLNVTIESEPEPKKKSETEVTLGYDLSVRIDPAKYRDFTKKARAILDLIALKKGTCVLRGRTAPKTLYAPFCTYFFPHAALPSAEARKRFPTPMRIDFTEYRENWWTRSFDPESQMVILLYTGGDRGGFETEWCWYHVPATDLDRDRLDLRVRFLGPVRQALVEDRVALGPKLPGYNLASRSFVHPKTRESMEGTQLLISPFFLLGPYYSTRAVLDRTVRLSLSDLREIRNIHCSASLPEMVAAEGRPKTRPPSEPPAGQTLPPLKNPLPGTR